MNLVVFCYLILHNVTIYKNWLSILTALYCKEKVFFRMELVLEVAYHIKHQYYLII